MASFGHIVLVGALALAVYGIGASLLGVRLAVASPGTWAVGRRGLRQWTDASGLVESGRNAAMGVTALYTVAAGVLLWAFVTHEFSIRYVFDNSNRAMPMDMLLPAFYSGQRGSLLYWGWTLSLFTAVVLWQLRRPGTHAALMPYVVAVLLGVQTYMLVLLGFVASPFERLPFAPADGVGLNPLLYDDGMKIHPPMLLAGYMSWSVPFAFAIAALASGRLDNDWLHHARRYAMAAWMILGLGNLLGAWWAYRVLGWGGYWGWDPVENVAILPWLTGTAFIHSLQIQERRGMLKAWNVMLLLVTFFLCIFGTFVVRSGILASVHSFALSQIGPFFLTYLALVIAGSLALFFWRLPRLRSENQLDSLLSREASFLLNNLLLVGITFAIFWGTVYPLVAELAGAGRISVGAPYFNQVAGPLLGGLLLLMGIGPLMPWRRASREHLVRNFAMPIGASLLGTVLLALVGVRQPPALVGFALCLFVTGTLAQEFWRGARARSGATGESYPLALVSLVRRNNRRYGGYLVHLAMVLIGCGVVASQSYQQEVQATLRAGESVSIGGYRLQLQGLQTHQGTGVRTVEAPVLVNGSEMLRPQKQFFQNFERQPSTRVAIRATPLEDLYLTLVSWDEGTESPRVTLHAYVNPLVGWIWTGGGLFLLGSTIALWPARQWAGRAAVSATPRGIVGAPA